jgi:tRNA-Thr(GGU) m(6)t(6)A37 methyltransferase TsaA
MCIESGPIKICFNPVGYVVEGIPRRDNIRRKIIRSRYEFVSKIKILDKYRECLLGLEDFSHIIVIWHAHLSTHKPCKVRPMGRPDMPLVGVFATRSPHRPNSVCVSIVELISIDGLELRVKGLDAWTNTPVLDIKPYTYYDIIRKPRVSDWFKKYWEEKNLELNYRELYPLLGPEE